MAEPFLGEIRLFSFNFPPRGWAACEGQILPINQNTALFALLGVTYGGNGVTTFALPNTIGSVLIGFNNAFPQGLVGGEINHTLTNAELPVHIHTIKCSNVAGTVDDPTGNFYGNAGAEKLYATTGPTTSAAVLSTNGSGQPHNNMQPSLAMNYCIALNGIFPSRN